MYDSLPKHGDPYPGPADGTFPPHTVRLGKPRKTRTGYILPVTYSPTGVFPAGPDEPPDAGGREHDLRMLVAAEQRRANTASAEAKRGVQYDPAAPWRYRPRTTAVLCIVLYVLILALLAALWLAGGTP